MSAPDENILRSMSKSIAHRGPDGAGIQVQSGIGLAHQRLAIIDLGRSGSQPMSIANGQYWIVFNGEIYNYVELRESLRQLGDTFDSNSDTEVILRLYQRHGRECVKHLNGMFAFAIWDVGKRELFCARDRMGIKPFYFYQDANQFVFASEIKAFLEVPGILVEPDYCGMADLFFAGAPLAGRTIFSGIAELQPAHTLVIKDRSVSIEEYWSIAYNYNFDRSLSVVDEELEALLSDAVRIHCRSDTPVGAHLSGGIDSSVVTALCAEQLTDLQSFSIKFSEGGSYDETAYAKAVSYFVGSNYNEKLGTKEDLELLLPKLIWHMDYPPAGGNDGGYTYYLAAKLASEHVKVSLTGHGGDELFAGYPAQFGTTFGNTNIFDGLPNTSRSIVTRAYHAIRRRGLSSVLGRLSQKLESGSAGGKSKRDTWVAYHCGPAPGESRLLSKMVKGHIQGYDSRATYLDAFDNAPTDEVLDKCLHHDLRVYLPQLLHKEDRASMAVSLESRVPLLDYRLVEFMATLPPDIKAPNTESKFLLRRLARRRLPTHVVDRKDKIPFAVPINEWVNSNAATGKWSEILRSEQFLDRGFFDVDYVRSSHITPQEKLAALNLEIWFRLFIDRDRELLE